MSNTLAGILTGPNLISCTGNLSLQDHDDLTHYTQFATHKADLISSRHENSTAWLKEYLSTLHFLGWSVFKDTFFTTTHTEVSISGSVADFLVKNVLITKDRRDENAMIDTLDALQHNQPAMVSLDQESQLGNHFQIMPAKYDSQGFLQTAVFNIEVITRTEKGNFLFWNWEDQSAKITIKRAYIRLNKDILHHRRAEVAEERAKIRMKRFDLWKITQPQI